MNTFRLFVRKIGSSKREILVEGSNKDCVVKLASILQQGREDGFYTYELMDIIREDSILFQRYVLDKEHEGKGFSVLKFLGCLSTQSDFGRSGMYKMNKILRENSSSFTLVCTDHNGERVTTGSGIFDWVSKTIVKAENTPFETLDAMIDNTLLALPANMCSEVHSINIKLNDDGVFSDRPIYFWFKEHGNSEYDFIIANFLEGVSYEL